MHIEYNGIVLELVRVTDFERYAVWTEDKTTYLYDHISIRCECLLNPDATTKEEFKAKKGGGVIAAGKRSSPVETYLEIAERLRTPRARLIITMDSGLDANADPEVVLESPIPGYDCDAVSGPKCVVHRIDPTHGLSTIWMDIQLETDIDTCARDSKPASAMIANRWTFVVSHDPSNHTAIHTIRGTANFRQDLLRKIGVVPDQLRKEFMHPIPIGFRRDPPTVIASPDGCSIEYEIVDREQLMSFVGSAKFHMTDISVVETRQYEKPNMPEWF